jgi:hypothetical protein
VATLHKLTGGAPPPELPPSTPEVIRVVIERALAYEAKDRFVTALEMNLACEGAMMEIGEPTTAAVVSHYTAELLADRKAARRKAVDSALASARNRDANAPGAPGGGATSPGMPIPSQGPSAPLVSTQSFTPAPPSTELPSAPSYSQQDGGGSYNSNAAFPLGYPEAPSAASQGTLGVASIEYPMPPPVDERARRKRYMSAAFLGVSLAAGVVGIVLIISTAVLKKDPNMAQVATAKSGAPVSATGTPPPEPAADPTPVPAPTPSPSPPPAATPVAHGGSLSSPPSTAPTTSTASPPHPPAPAAAPAPTHKSGNATQPAPYTPPKPASPAPKSTGKYGF